MRMDTLFISASFFGYQKDIIDKLRGGGRRVMWFEDRPATDNFTKAAIRISPNLLKRRNTAYFDGIIEQAAAHDIRDVFVIKGEAMSPDIVVKMRRAMPKARFTLYYWDSYRNMPADSAEKVSHFDKVFSFDPVDVANDSRLMYRPLFYVDDYRKIENAHKDIDVLFLGTIHSDRYEVVKRIGASLPSELTFSTIMYMRSPWLYLTSKVLRPSYRYANKSDFVFEPIDRASVMDVLSRSRIVIDIERAVQTGFTMRTIEMLGASKKLITTNSRIKKADFFKPTNQLHVDREKVVIPESFLASDWQPDSPELLEKYSIGGWLREILD